MPAHRADPAPPVGAAHRAGAPPRRSTAGPEAPPRRGNARPAAAPRLLLLLLGVLVSACGGTSAQAGLGDDVDPVTYRGTVTELDVAARRVGLELHDAPHAARTWALATDARAAVLECAAACETVAVPIAALAEGRAIPHGGTDAVFDVTLEHGTVVAVEEREAAPPAAGAAGGTQ